MSCHLKSEMNHTTTRHENTTKNHTPHITASGPKKISQTEKNRNRVNASGQKTNSRHNTRKQQRARKREEKTGQQKDNCEKKKIWSKYFFFSFRLSRNFLLNFFLFWS